MNNVNQLCNEYFDTYKNNCDREKLKVEEKRERDYKWFPMIDNGDQEPKSTEKEESKTEKLDKIQKPSWIK